MMREAEMREAKMPQFKRDLRRKLLRLRALFRHRYLNILPQVRGFSVDCLLLIAGSLILVGNSFLAARRRYVLTSLFPAKII
jgi:hypothetical protein